MKLIQVLLFVAVFVAAAFVSMRLGYLAAGYQFWPEGMNLRKFLRGFFVHLAHGLADSRSERRPA